MASYLDRRDHETVVTKREERIATQEVDPEIAAEMAEAKAAKQARVDAALAEAALLVAGDSEAVARDNQRQAENDERWARHEEESQNAPDHYAQGERSEFADY